MIDVFVSLPHPHVPHFNAGQRCLHCLHAPQCGGLRMEPQWSPLPLGLLPSFLPCNSLTHKGEEVMDSGQEAGKKITVNCLLLSSPAVV